MNLRQLAEYRTQFEVVPDEVLLAMLYEDDSRNHSADELEAAQRILMERGVQLPGRSARPASNPETHRAEGLEREQWGYETHPHQRGPDYRHYQDVPWYRRSNVNSALVLTHCLTLGLLPLGLVTCAVVLTGQVYYRKKDEGGYLRKWGPANKIAAIVLLAASLAATIALSIKYFSRPPLS
jgi:hypothetical protein